MGNSDDSGSSQPHSESLPAPTMINQARNNQDGLLSVLSLLRPTLVIAAKPICPNSADERADDAVPGVEQLRQFPR